MAGFIDNAMAGFAATLMGADPMTSMFEVVSSGVIRSITNGAPGSRAYVNRSKYTPRDCENLRPQQRRARQQAKIAARKAVL